MDTGGDKGPRHKAFEMVLTGLMCDLMYQHGHEYECSKLQSGDK